MSSEQNRQSADVATGLLVWYSFLLPGDFSNFLVDVGLALAFSTRGELHRQAVYRDLGKQLERLLVWKTAVITTAHS